MWLLTCDGDLFGGKRLWLRPGSTHLFGRTSKTPPAEGEKARAIDHKSVSRKHLTIEVGAVKEGDSTRLRTRSVVTLKDNSKVGTTINGEKIKEDSNTLTEKENTVKLGNYEHLFHLKWHPVTLTFGHLSKKAGKDSLKPWRERLEQADIKVALEYVTNETTHVIAKKRNTPPSLQALLQARWLLTEDFADAVTAAVQKNASNASAIEDDFDGYWPKEDKYLLPSGAEQNPRPSKYVKPNPERSDLFQDYTFIFLVQSQYDTLFPVVAAGGGKALVRDASTGSASVSNVVEFVKEVTGRKGSNQFLLSQHTGKGGVVIVRANNPDADLERLNTELDQTLDQRSVEQSEFLDVILTADTSSLRKPLREETPAPLNSRTASSRPQSQRGDDMRQQRAVTVPDSPAPVEEDPAQPPEQQEEPEASSALARRRNRRTVTASRFKSFDDFDPSQFSKPVAPSQELPANSQEGSGLPNDNDMDVDQPSQHPSNTQRTSRKRPAPIEEEAEDRENMLDNVLKGHAAMKKQKTLAGETGQHISFSKAAEQIKSEKAAKAKKREKQIDVQAEMAARKEREQEQRRRDEEERQAGVPDISHEDAQKLLKIEEMEISERAPPARTRGDAASGRGDRWDPAWNGRKNFKKFRPQGQRGENAPRLQRVIVALEEVPRKGHGLGDQYWLTSKGSKKSKSQSQSQSQSQSVRQGASRSQAAAAEPDDENDEEDITSFRRRGGRDTQYDAQFHPMEDVEPDEIAGHARDPAIEALAQANSAASQSQSQRKASSGKRPAALAAVGAQPAAKKARAASGRAAKRAEVVEVDSEDEDDGLKFRRRKR